MDAEKVMTKVPDDHPLMVAWNEYKALPEYENAKQWATAPAHTEGSLWAAFMAGWCKARALEQRFAGGGVVSGQLVWTEEEAAEMKERFQRRFGEPLPRTESLFAVAAVGYRKGLNTRPSLAEIEALRADLAESDEIREKLGHLLTRTAAALKGEPPAGVWHSWHDLPEKAAQLAERVHRDEALLRQALEVLLGQRGEPDWHTGKQRENTITALRERLEVSNG